MDLDFFELRRPSAFEVAALFVVLLVAGFFLYELSVNHPDDLTLRTYQVGFTLTLVLALGAGLIALTGGESSKLFLRFLGFGDFDEKILGVPKPVFAAVLGVLIIAMAQTLPLLHLFTFQEKTFSASTDTDFNRVVVGSVFLEDTLDFILIPTIAALLTTFGFVAGLLPVLFLSFFWLPFDQFFFVVIIAIAIVLLGRKGGANIGYKPNPLISLFIAILIVSAFFGFLHGLRSGFDPNYIFAAAKFRFFSAIGAFALGSIAFPYALHATNNGFAWGATGFSALLPGLAIVGLTLAFWWVKSQLARRGY